MEDPRRAESVNCRFETRDDCLESECTTQGLILNADEPRYTADKMNATRLNLSHRPQRGLKRRERRKARTCSGSTCPRQRCLQHRSQGEIHVGVQPSADPMTSSLRCYTRCPSIRERRSASTGTGRMQSVHAKLPAGAKRAERRASKMLRKSHSKSP